MQPIARLCAVLLIAATACGGDDEEAPRIPGGGGADSSTNGDGGGNDADSGSYDWDSGQSTPEDAGKSDAATSNDGGPTLDLEIPKAIVECNGQPCDVLENVCCESWGKGMGFKGELSCITRDACNKKYSRSGEQNRAVTHECDDKSDCSAGQVCCFYAYGQPLCELGDILECTTKMVGPGGSRICADNDACQLGSVQYIGDGAPIGELSCLTDADCADRPGKTCQSEQDNSITTGKASKARSYVKVCR